jgi:hypothetical protein
MQTSEIFLLVWAGIATALAVWFNHEARKAHFVLFKTMYVFKDLAEGKAEVSIENGNLKIKEKEDATTK